MVESAALEVPMEMIALEWILTYAIHSSILIIGVWLTTKVFRWLSLSTQESLWKAALLGGMVTASLQMAMGLESPWGRFDLPAELDTAPIAVVERVSEAPSAVPGDVELERSITKHRSGDLTITTIRESRPVVAAPIVTTTTQPMTPSPWPWVILSLVGLGAVFCVGRLGLAARKLRQQLHGRREVVEDPLLESFLTLCNKAGFGEKDRKKRLKLTATPNVASPLALRREVVVPERAITGLTPPQQQAMLAHEMAHVLRRDPLWTIVTASVEALFFFQPLNLLARRKIQEVAEFQCDEWAAEHTGSGAHLAKAIAAVAGWVARGERDTPLAATMAQGGSSVLRRVRRLTRHRRSPAKDAGGWFAMRLGGTLALLGGVLWLAPGIGRAAHRHETTNESEPGDIGPLLSAMVAERDDDDRDVVFREVETEDGREKAQVRIETDDEVFKVEVDRDPVPPPPPEPPPSSDRGGVRIIIGGSFEPFGWGSGWGYLDVDVGDLDGEMEALEEQLEGLLEPGFPFAHSHRHDRHKRHERRVERALERAARAQERAERARARALERAERARDRAEEARERASEYAEHAAEARPSAVYEL